MEQATLGIKTRGLILETGQIYFINRFEVGIFAGTTRGKF